MARETILIVDDEEDIIELIKYNLKTEGYVILTAGTGEQALKTARKSLPDLIVLDLMLPGIDGLDVTRHLKNNDQTADIPIVMVTAKGEESDVVTGLELGANDYISKPFSPRELVARIRAILRRRRKTGEKETASGIRQIGDMVIDRARHVVTIQGQPIDLTLSEFELLSFLADKKGWVISRSLNMYAIHW